MFKNITCSYFETLHRVLSHKKNKIWGKKYLGGISRLLLAIVEIEFTTLKNPDLLVFIFKYNLSIPLIWFVKLTWLYTMPDYYIALWHPNQPTSSNQLQNLENCLKNLLCGKLAKNRSIAAFLERYWVLYID